MRKAVIVVLFVCTLAFVSGWVLGIARAQSVVPPITILAPSLTHTSCVVTTGTTSFCFASDGLWQSINGGAFTQLGGAGGVTSVTVCNAAGAACGAAQTGAVSLSIPKSVTVTVGNPTVSATQGAVTATLN